MSKHIIPDVPYIWQGTVPACHVTSLRMVLEFYGIKYTHSYLMNLSGFNYGFRYFKGHDLAFAVSESYLGPWAFMSYAAEKLGCRIEFTKNRPWEESWELLKGYIEKDIPVYMPLLNMQYLWKTVRPVPHVVLFCGYDEEKGVVMLHDPALGETGEGIPYLPRQYLPPEGLVEGELYEGKSGSYARFNIDDFRKACDLKGTAWQEFGRNGLCVIHPPAGRPEVSWAEVMRRNAKITLGKVNEVVGEKVAPDSAFGPDGIMELASDLEEGFGLTGDPKALVAILGGLSGMTFRVGWSHKVDAHSFLVGLAQATGNRELEQAAYNLRLTALCYEQGLAEVEYILQKEASSPEVLLGKLARIAELLRRAAEYERKAGENMSKGAEALD